MTRMQFATTVNIEKSFEFLIKPLPISQKDFRIIVKGNLF